MIYQIDFIKQHSGNKFFSLSGDFKNKAEALRASERISDKLDMRDAYVIVGNSPSEETNKKLDIIVEELRALRVQLAEKKGN